MSRARPNKKTEATLTTPKRKYAPPQNPIEALRYWRRLIDKLSLADRARAEQVTVFAEWEQGTEILLSEAHRLGLDSIAVQKASDVLFRYALTAAERWKAKRHNTHGWKVRAVPRLEALPVLVKLPAAEVTDFREGLAILKTLEARLNRERPNATPRAVSKSGMAILAVLKENHPAAVGTYDLEQYETLPVRRTIETHLSKLIGAGLAVHVGKRGGYTITQAGIDLLDGRSAR
jgi:hypothetical protein